VAAFFRWSPSVVRVICPPAPVPKVAPAIPEADDPRLQSVADFVGYLG